MNKEWLVIISKRFVKIFLIGGLGAVVMALGQHPLEYLGDWKPWLVVLVNAFFVGGVAALEKWSQGYNPR